MTEQNGGTPSSFEELVKKSLDPLYQQESSKQKFLGEVQEVATDAEQSIDQRQGQEFLERQGMIRELLGKFDVDGKLRHIKNAVWKKGVIETVKEPFEINGVDTGHSILLGYRLIYSCRAVVEIEGETSVREGIDNIPQRYFPTSESQIIEIRTTQAPTPNTISVDSQSRLNIPDKFHKHDFNPIIDPEWLDKCIVTAYVGGVDLKDVLAPVSFHPLLKVARHVIPRILLSGVSGYEDYQKHQIFGRSGSIELFDEFLAQDCAERFRKGKLPLQTQEFWLNYIRRSDQYFNQNSKDKWGRYIQGPDSDSVFAEKIRNCKLPKIMRSRFETSMSNVTLNYADNPGSQLREEEQKKFRSDFKEMNGIDFDDVVTWLRDVTHVVPYVHYARGLYEMFNSLNSDLQTSPADQQLLLRRDQVAIALLEGRYSTWVK